MGARGPRQGCRGMGCPGPLAQSGPLRTGPVHCALNPQPHHLYLIKINPGALMPTSSDVWL